MREQIEYIHSIYKGGADSFYIFFRETEIEKANLPDYVTPISYSKHDKPLEDLVEELERIGKSGDGKKTEESQPENKEPENLTEKDRLKNHYNVPFGSKGDGFVGRVGKLVEIWNALNKDSRAAIGQAVAIEGFGGLGKTLK